MKNKKRLFRGFLLIICMCMFICGLGGCRAEELVITNETGTSIANIAMGRGCFAYQNGLLYFSDISNIYEYDMESEKTVFFPINKPGDPNDLHVTQNHIVYSGFTEEYNRCAMAITKDGKTTSTAFVPSAGCYCLYLNEKEAYYLSGKGGDLFHRNMETGDETMLLQKVQSYSLTNSHLYVTQVVDEKFVLKTRAHGEDGFHAIPLTFEPVQVLAADNALFLQKTQPYQIVCYCDGEETPLPIYSIKYQFLNDQLIYADEKAYKDSTWTVKSYNMNTATEQVLCEEVFEFGVFEEGFAVFWCRTDMGSVWKLFDFENNELKQIYPSA